MFIFRLFIGTLYDLGRLMAGLSVLGGIGYFVKSLVLDSQPDFFVALAHFMFGLAFWIIARVFRRYAF